MFDLEINRTRAKRIKKDIKNSKKRKAFVMDDKYLLKLLIAFLIVTIPTAIELLIIDNLILGTFYPLILLSGAVGITIKETFALFRDDKASNNLNEVVNVLESNNVKTTKKSLINSEIRCDLSFDKDNQEKKVMNYCYFFLDNKDNVQCLLEDDSKRKLKYSLLEEQELNQVDLPKVKKLIKERVR